MVDWDKGKALQHLLEALGLDKSKDVMPLYIGDDRTDEDAFKVLRDRGLGCGILVADKVCVCVCVWICVFSLSVSLWHTDRSTQGSSTAGVGWAPTKTRVASIVLCRRSLPTEFLVRAVPSLLFEGKTDRNSARLSPFAQAKHTAAAYHLRDTHEVGVFLSKLVDWGKEEANGWHTNVQCNGWTPMYTAQNQVHKCKSEPGASNPDLPT